MRTTIVTVVLAASGGLFADTNGGLDAPLATVVASAAPTVCDAHAVAQRIARAANVPLGFEAIATCNSETYPPRLSGSWNFERSLPAAGENTMTLTGKSARVAFDWLIEKTPEYSWREVNGIPVVRPKGAWSDGTNALNARADALAGEMSLEDALNLVLLRELRGASSDRFGRRQIVLTFRGGTIAEALSAIVAADRSRGWDAVTIERPTQFHRATPVLIVGLRTSNPNVGGGVAYVLDPANLVTQ